MRRAPLPPHLTTGSFSLRAADKAGLTRSRTRANDLVTVSRGIRVPLGYGTGSGAVEALRAYTDLDDLSVLVHASAARIWGVPLPGYCDADWRVHLARRRGFSFPRRANVVGHLLTFLPGEIVEYDGVRLTSPARTWLDLAASLTVPELVAVGDNLVCAHGEAFPRPKEALCDAGQLHAMARAHPGKRGVRAAKAALELVRVGADSAPETIMRLALLDAGLSEPVLNYVVYDVEGRPVMWPDAAYPEARVALQYDGGHHAGPGQYLRDISRQETALTYGWLEVRVSWLDLQGDRPDVVRKVRRALRSRGLNAR